jgi:hypothetical protein
MLAVQMASRASLDDVQALWKGLDTGEWSYFVSSDINATVCISPVMHLPDMIPSSFFLAKVVNSIHYTRRPLQYSGRRRATIAE